MTPARLASSYKSPSSEKLRAVEGFARKKNGFCLAINTRNFFEKNPIPIPEAVV
jgi:hypothetical protein